MRKIIRIAAGAAAVCVVAFFGYKACVCLMQGYKSSKLNNSLADRAVLVGLPEIEPAQKNVEKAPVQVDFELLHEQNEDSIAWLYCEGTQINYPVVQAQDNDYYLRRLLDGSYNIAGTIFADCRNAADFSDRNTIIYGHNMKNKSMFGILPEFADQQFYDEHPTAWLLTEAGNFKVELIAGYTTPADSGVYTFPKTENEAAAFAKAAIECSDFKTDVQLRDGDCFITLSTCSYAYEDARYVLVGRITKDE